VGFAAAAGAAGCAGIGAGAGAPCTAFIAVVAVCGCAGRGRAAAGAAAGRAGAGAGTAGRAGAGAGTAGRAGAGAGPGTPAEGGAGTRPSCFSVVITGVAPLGNNGFNISSIPVNLSISPTQLRNAFSYFASIVFRIPPTLFRNFPAPRPEKITAKYMYLPRSINILLFSPIFISFNTWSSVSPPGLVVENESLMNSWTAVNIPLSISSSLPGLCSRDRCEIKIPLLCIKNTSLTL
jgi:hypothetical protein